jgi:hypothetical protein
LIAVLHGVPEVDVGDGSIHMKQRFGGVEEHDSKRLTGLCIVVFVRHVAVTENNSNAFTHLSAVLLTKNIPPASFKLVNDIGDFCGFYDLRHRQQSCRPPDG